MPAGYPNVRRDDARSCGCPGRHRRDLLSATLTLQTEAAFLQRGLHIFMAVIR